MYTQCPDCEIAFKVTAEVLKQAAGKVRCGGCGHAFNALAYLSEQMPTQPDTAAADDSLPELKPEIIETDSKPPHSISAEQSAALLKTLDELAGSDIRIEDTGVEWRVLDEQEAAEPAADDDDAGQVGELPAESAVDDRDVGQVDEPAADSATPIDELRFDDNTPLPEDFDLDADRAQALQTTPEADPEDIEAELPEPQADIELSEPDEWQDILGEFQELVEEVATPIDDEIEHEPEALQPLSDGPPDMDTQFALQAEAMGIDLSGIDKLEEEIDEETGALDDFDDLDDLDDLGPLDELDEPGTDEPAEPDELDESAAEETPEEPVLGEQGETTDVDDETGEPGFADAISQLDFIEEQVEPVIENHTIEEELAALEAETTADDEEQPGHHVPPMSEEEHTVNMQIDQDLMALAIEDEDGFASTIIIPGQKVGEKADDADAVDSEPQAETADNDAGFESIVMEGEFVHSALDSEKLEADTAAAAALAELARTQETESTGVSGSSRGKMIGGVVALTLFLLVQMVHQSREALATIPAFSNTVGQIYRAIGRPIQPAWDVTGWRIEATNDTVDIQEETENLTIYSRIGNNSDGPMPYPLVSISLTDRFLETIGSQMLDPVDYLPDGHDPRKPVGPGNTFNAVMSIQSPSTEATGYKVDVCYRQSDGRLRCAIDDFK